ncbi:probable transmembrane protein [Sulfuriferula multivorans]|uniref:Probable transmembrane protein n=1 Tax=Sulfuriferula multivorans TaxID=1559896 RepID=A0A401JBR8_9PROT|nr:hypothetical protein [Sulfuriferula multivorans]GBL45128.1 probable transmembrane protein [Sulfuriferula multivorans]
MNAPISSLSLQQAPPISVPFRFFLSAPLFLLLAALILLISGPQALVSRWTPALLALTHLVTLGFLTMTMIGALMQMFPVLADSPMPQPRRVAWMVHVPLVAGTAMLASGLFFSQTVLLDAAIFLLAFALGVFLIAAAYSLAASRVRHATIHAMRFAGIALMLTVGLGIALAGTLSGDFHFPVQELVRLHVAWGLPGWVGLLVMGVAYQVVPMFQLTPAYPARLTRWLGGSVFLLLCAGSLTSLTSPLLASWGDSLAAGGIAIGFAVFAGATLYLQAKRRRRIVDVTQQFWRIGMLSLLSAVALWGGAQLLTGIAADSRYPIVLGVLFMFGFAVSVVSGMLYKIVPFLIWFHLQGGLPKGSAVPNMKQIISGHAARRQMQAHLATLLLLLGSIAWPALVYPAALTLGFASCLLWLNLFAATRLYLKFARL